MTKAEVSAVIGEPLARKYSSILVYGPEKRISISFDENTGEAQFIYGCDGIELGDEKAKRFREKAEKWDKERMELEEKWDKERKQWVLQKKQKPKAEESQTKR